MQPTIHCMDCYQLLYQYRLFTVQVSVFHFSSPLFHSNISWYKPPTSSSHLQPPTRCRSKCKCFYIYNTCPVLNLCHFFGNLCCFYVFFFNCCASCFSLFWSPASSTGNSGTLGNSCYGLHYSWQPHCSTNRN